MVLDPQLEQMMSSAVQNNQGVIEPNLLDTMVKGIGDAAEKMEAEGAQPRPAGLGNYPRIPLKLLRGRMSNFYILAYEEIPGDKNIRKIVTTVEAKLKVGPLIASKIARQF